MHAACALCRGACCESIVLSGLPAEDNARYLALHGTTLPDGAIELPTPCTKLSLCGRCTIHATRPQLCRAYPVGGPACRATIARRRPAQAAEILALLP